MLGDSLLLLAGTQNANGSVTPFSFATNPTTAGTALLMPYLLENSHQNSSGLNSNYGVDLGAGEPVFLRWTFMNDANGAAVNNLASITDVKIDLFQTSNSGTAAITGSAANALFLGTAHLNDGVNYPLNYSSLCVAQRRARDFE